MAACDLDLFLFDHLLASQGSRLDDLPRRLYTQGSPAVDLTAGFDDYVGQQKKVSRSLFQSTERKRRKLEKERGQIRLSFHEPNHQLLDDVLKWKSNQYRRTGRRDRFANAETRALVHVLLDMETSTFGAPLTVLYAGDSVVAAHLGVRSRHTLAWWFPMYNPAFAAYSPGLVLLLEMAKAMTTKNLSLLDLGKGDESYKQRVANTRINLLEGSVASNRATHMLHTARTWPARQLTNIVLQSPQLRRLSRRTLNLAGRVRRSA
jgi:CelD/BcsL family acetyltransferase involved in cellulose biosynthesis